MRRSLRTHREKNDVRGLLGVLEMCVRDNFGGVESARYVTFITSEAEQDFISCFDRLYSEVRSAVHVSGMKIDRKHQDLLWHQILD